MDPLSGWGLDVPWWSIVLESLLVFSVLGFTGAPLWVWSPAVLALLFVLGAPLIVLIGAAVVLALFVVRPIRRVLFSGPLMRLLDSKNLLPRISPTEQAAIEAGSVWIEGELFSGKPDFKRILSQPYPTLTAEERAFLEGPVEELCKTATDWEIQTARDFPDSFWKLIRKERFFGMIVPKKYGGHKFSAAANSAVVAKLSGHSYPMAITVMVPNSLGPAELLTHYGTPEQQDYFLPRLAAGTLKPAFALTEPTAGSDAGSMLARGVVFRDESGEPMIRLNWNKRYITLASISELLGLAFKLEDPENILGKGKRPGITCALIPTDTPGVVLGMRHDPLGVAFVNAPTKGHDVVLPVDAIIGGADGAGRGWIMLTECLSAGRGISLPATSVGSVKYLFKAVSAHALIRKQFGVSIGRFEGIQEVLARIGGFAYLMDAARIYTVGALDQGASPAVVTAIVKYNLTELSRKAVNDAMDIMAGNGISMGPRNTIGGIYMSSPIAITVEGANILTRTLIIFGQGAIRCHPWAYRQVKAIQSRDVKAFDYAFWSHVGHVVRNAFRMVLLGASRGYLAGASGVRGPAARYVRRMKWVSAAFAFWADVAMITLGGKLKRKEMITGRFADILSWMYLATATIWRYETDGRIEKDRAYFHWSMDYAMARIQAAFEGLFANMKVPGFTWFIRGPVMLVARMNSMGRAPSDKLSSKVARLMQIPGAQRSRLTHGCYVPAADKPGLGRLEEALVMAYEAGKISKKVYKAVRKGKIAKYPKGTQNERAAAAGVISEEEFKLMQKAERVCSEAIQVDAFNEKDYFHHHQMPREPEMKPMRFAAMAA